MDINQIWRSIYFSWLSDSVNISKFQKDWHRGRVAYFEYRIYDNGISVALRSWNICDQGESRESTKTLWVYWVDSNAGWISLSILRELLFFAVVFYEFICWWNHDQDTDSLSVQPLSSFEIFPTLNKFNFHTEFIWIRKDVILDWYLHNSVWIERMHCYWFKEYKYIL